MIAHPSLTEPPLKATLTTPLKQMGRNEACWCRSGLKYKKCHLDREKQAEVNVFEVEAKLIAELREGYCSHPDTANDPCSEGIIKAHTIQKRGGIAAIAEKGHVLTVKPTMKDLIESKGKPSPRKIGINNASVFPGFCNKHDTALFKPIEGKSLCLNKETAFLLSYRAIAYERFTKEVQLRAIAAQREMDRGKSFIHQSVIQTCLNALADGIQIGLRDVERWKAQFDTRLLSNSYEDFHFLALTFDNVLPVVASCAFHPEFDLQGNPLQRLGRDGVDLEHIALNVTTFGNQTTLVLGWIGSNDGPAKGFADSFVRVADDRKANVLVRLLFLQTDNLFLKPSWWNGLPPARQEIFKGLLLSGLPMHARLAEEYIDDGTSVVASTAIEIVNG